MHPHLENRGQSPPSIGCTKTPFHTSKQDTSLRAMKLPCLRTDRPCGTLCPMTLYIQNWHWNDFKTGRWKLTSFVKHMPSSRSQRLCDLVKGRLINVSYIYIYHFLNSQALGKTDNVKFQNYLNYTHPWPKLLKETQTLFVEYNISILTNGWSIHGSFYGGRPGVGFFFSFSRVLSRGFVPWPLQLFYFKISNFQSKHRMIESEIWPND